MEMGGAIILKTAGCRDTLISKTVVSIFFFEDGDEWGQYFKDCIGGSLYFEDGSGRSNNVKDGSGDSLYFDDGRGA